MKNTKPQYIVSPMDKALDAAWQALVEDAADAAGEIGEDALKDKSPKALAVSHIADSIWEAIDSGRILDACAMAPGMSKTLTMGGSVNGDWFDAYKALRGKLLVCAAVHAMKREIADRMESLDAEAWESCCDREATDAEAAAEPANADA